MSRIGVTGLCLTLLHSFFTPAQAQDRQTVTQATEWTSATSSIKLTNRLTLMTEAHFRFVQMFEPMQVQVRTGLDLKLNKNWSVLPLGYVYTINPKYGKQPNVFVNNEHRLFEQVVLKHHAGKVNVSHRLRLEQRYIQVHTMENNDIVIDHGFTLHTNRLRYKIQGELPVGSGSEGKPWLAVVVSEEIFLSFGDAVVYHEPDQNRLFAGLSYHFTKDFYIQGGPFYQILIKSGGKRQENNIGALFTITYNFDFSKE